MAWQAGVVICITLAPALLKARLEGEVLAEPWSLFDKGVFVSSLEDLAEDYVGLEEDGLWMILVVLSCGVPHGALVCSLLLFRASLRRTSVMSGPHW